MNPPSRPWMKFYPSDWRADPLLRSCEPLSRYVWLEMIGLMHEAEPYGHLVFAGRAMTPAVLARNIAVEVAVVDAALVELEELGVFSRTQDGMIYSRRMVRDEEKHRRASNFGKRGARAKARKDKEEPATLEGTPEGSLEGTHQPRDQRPESPRRTPQKKTRGSKRPLPGDWDPVPFGDGTQSRAIVDGWTRLEFERQLEAFRARHIRDASQFADWQQAWSTWVLNSERFAERDRRGGGSGAPRSFVDQVLEEAGRAKPP